MGSQKLETRSQKSEARNDIAPRRAASPKGHIRSHKLSF